MTEQFIRIGTRGSRLALAQAHEVRARLAAATGRPETDFTVEIISTSGDRIQDRPLSEVGGKGLFTKEIEEALLGGRIDLAVHSAKDMATRLPAGLAVAAYLPREDVRDVFVGRSARRISDLPQGAVVGSASLRRQALLRRLRPDLDLRIFRGNVQTRLAKLERGEVEGTLLALAGLKRLGDEDVASEILPLDLFPPAPGQGAIAIELREGDRRVEPLAATIDHAETHAALRAERAFLAELDGSCRTPIAGHAVLENGSLRFHGLILSPDGRTAHETHASAEAGEAEALGRDCGLRLRREAGEHFFETW